MPKATNTDEVKAIMMFKIINHLVNIPANPFLTPLTTVHSTRGHNMRFMQPMTRIDSYMYSFFSFSNQNLE